MFSFYFLILRNKIILRFSIVLRQIFDMIIIIPTYLLENNNECRMIKVSIRELLLCLYNLTFDEIQ